MTFVPTIIRRNDGRRSRGYLKRATELEQAAVRVRADDDRRHMIALAAAYKKAAANLCPEEAD